MSRVEAKLGASGLGAGGELGPAGDPATAADAQFAFILGLDLDLSLLKVQGIGSRAPGRARASEFAPKRDQMI